MPGSKESGQSSARSIASFDTKLVRNGSLAFVRPLLHGVCVGVRIEDGSDAAGRADLARQTDGAAWRERSHASGRVALRTALLEVGVSPDRVGTIGATSRGAPITPEGTAGSISHKRSLAVGLAAADAEWCVGVDIEARKPTRRDISRRVLTPDEREEVARIQDDRERALAVILRFSLKEAIYKAIDPFVQRYVGFREVSVSPLDRGREEGGHREHRVEVIAALDPAPERALEIQACWTEAEGFYLCAARARVW